MTFYIIGNEQLIKILESCPTKDDLKQLADECEVDELWVIVGQHSGITYERPTEPEPKPRIVFGQPIPAELAEEPKPRNLSLWSTQ